MTSGRKDSQLTIVLIGKVGAGKTAVLKTLLSCSDEKEKPESHILLTSDIDKDPKKKVKIGEESVVVVDTPGLSIENTEKAAEDIKRSLSSLGGFWFVFVIEPGPFTSIEERIVKVFLDTFGECAAKYTLVLFTRGDILKEENITEKQFLEDSKTLNKFVSQCNGQTFIIDNKNPDLSQVTKLLQQIHHMVDKCKGKGYICGETEKSAELKKKISFSISVSALAGAGVGAAAAYFAGGAVSILVGVTVGAAVGAVLGCVGFVAAKCIQAKICVK